MSKIFVDQVDPKTATTLTLGTTGDTDNVPTGVSLTITDQLAIAQGGTGATTLAGAGLSNTPAFSVRLNASQALSNSTNTKVAYDVEQVDTDSAFASNKFTVPAGEAGTYYFIHAPTIQSTGAGATLCRSYVYVNGAQVTESDLRIVTGTGHYENTPVTTYMATLSESDYVEGYVRIEGGSATETIEPTYRSWFVGYKIIT